jgi:hypothetical protein
MISRVVAAYLYSECDSGGREGGREGDVVRRMFMSCDARECRHAGTNKYIDI